MAPYWPRSVFGCLRTDNFINSIQLIRFFTNIGNLNRNRTGQSKLGKECYGKILQYMTDSH